MRITLSERGRYLLVMTATILPIASLMLIVFFSYYQPVSNSMQRILHESINGMQPINELQIAMLKAAMPPNDYLIHGDQSEARHWQQAILETDQAFELAIRGVHIQSETLLNAQTEWRQACAIGDHIFNHPIESTVRPDLSQAMEEFDAQIYQITSSLGQITGEMDQHITREYEMINRLKRRSVTATAVGILLGLIMGISGSIWLSRDHTRIIRQNRLDPLTSALNRRALEDALQQMQHSHEGSVTSCFALAMLDIDHFKEINDTHGHDAGDQVLKCLVTRINSLIRATDILGRYGGEEFLILLPTTSRSDAVRLAERIRTAIEEQPLSSKAITITVSIGLACFPNDAPTALEAVKLADRALYRAKREGRNRVIGI